MDVVSENLPLILGVALGGLFVLGLALALRTESGRASLARAAVRLAVAALGFAEGWLGAHIPGPGDGVTKIMDEPRDHDVLLARVSLTAWLARQETGQSDRNRVTR